jgi:hypothetical protein
LNTGRHIDEFRFIAHFEILSFNPLKEQILETALSLDQSLDRVFRAVNRKNDVRLGEGANPRNRSFVVAFTRVRQDRCYAALPLPRFARSLSLASVPRFSLDTDTEKYLNNPKICHVGNSIRAQRVASGNHPRPFTGF